jgi:hypothetical protein
MKTIHKTLAGAALVGTTFLGGAIGASMVGTASAQEGDTSSTTVIDDQAPSAPEGQAPADRDGGSAPAGPHAANGVTEELLTGDTAAKVTAAAEAAVEGATVDRVETDAEGAAYEAHVTDADGAQLTVKLDESFNVTSVEEGNC